MFADWMTTGHLRAYPLEQLLELYILADRLEVKLMCFMVKL
jgi:hypothetical protein